LKILFIVLFIINILSCNNFKESDVIVSEMVVFEVEESEIEISDDISIIEMLQLFSSPMKDYRISSKFGFRKNPMGGEEFDMHKGIDIVGSKNANIYAVYDGKVVIHFPPPNGYFKGHHTYGALIIIDHGKGLFTLYGHMSSTFVNEGMYVKKGQLIGKQGSTGRSTGPHLHFEIIFDPAYVLN